MPTPGFIPDGYTREGFIKATEFHPETSLRFEYRPMVPHERIRAQKRITDAKTDELGETEAHKLIVSRVTSWDLSYEGRPIELTTENVARLEPHLSARLFQIVMGYAVDDSAERPDVEQAENDLKN